jgi:hypothetical protein
MKLKFIIDRKYDEEIAKGMGFSEDVIKKISSEYKILLPVLKLTKTIYQKSWNEINDDFSKYIERVTGYKWSYPKYECVVSAAIMGASNWGDSSKIVRWWRENPYGMRRTTAHELILSHYFSIIKKNYSNEGLKDGQIWALAEIAAFALTSLTKESKKWWPWDAKYYTNHSYQHIVEIQNKLKPIFLERKNFDDYIKEGIKLIKKYPDMNPKSK